MFLTKSIVEKIRNWKMEGYLSEDYKLVIKSYEGTPNYISIELLDENEDLEGYVDLNKEYEDSEIEQMKKNAKKIRSEIARKLNMSVKKFELIHTTV